MNYASPSMQVAHSNNSMQRGVTVAFLPSESRNARANYTGGYRAMKALDFWRIHTKGMGKIGLTREPTDSEAVMCDYMDKLEYRLAKAEEKISKINAKLTERDAE